MIKVFYINCNHYKRDNECSVTIVMYYRIKKQMFKTVKI